MTISVPDLNITLYEDLPKENQFSTNYATQLGKRVLSAWIKAQEVMKRKKETKSHLPEASMIRNSVKLMPKPLTPTQFSKYVGVSYRTIIRDCEKGLIHSDRTSGGHYKIPHSEISLYKDYLKHHSKHAHEPWTLEAMEKLRQFRNSLENERV